MRLEEAVEGAIVAEGAIITKVEVEVHPPTGAGAVADEDPDRIVPESANGKVEAAEGSQGITTDLRFFSGA